MITLTRLNGVAFVLNSELIETIQQNPDTTIRLNNGSLYIVREPVERVIELVQQYKRDLLRGAFGEG